MFHELTALRDRLPFVIASNGSDYHLINGVLHFVVFSVSKDSVTALGAAPMIKPIIGQSTSSSTGKVLH